MEPWSNAEQCPLSRPALQKRLTEAPSTAGSRGQSEERDVLGRVLEMRRGSGCPVVNICCQPGMYTWCRLLTQRPGRPALCVGPAGLLCSLLAPGQLVEQLLVESFILVLGAGGQENVAPDVLMHDFAIRAQAGECDGDVLVKFDRHLEEEGTGILKL